MPSLSDGEWILVILTVLYFTEALVWVRPGSVPFVSSWGGFASRSRPRRLTGNDQGDLILGGLGPFDVTLLAEPLPLSIGQEGVVAFVATSPLQKERPQQSGGMVSWDEAAGATACGRSVIVAGRPLCAVRSERAASALAARLRQIAQGPAEDRAAQIEAWQAEPFAVDAVRRRMAAWEESTLVVRMGSLLLCFWIFPLGVALFYGWLPIAPDGLVTMIYLVLLFVIWWLTALIGVLSHRYLYPQDRSGRIKQALYSLVSPAVPLRLADALGRELLDFQHPLAVSSAIDSPERFRQTAQQILRDATYPQLPEEPPELSEAAREIVRQSRQTELQQLERIVAAQGIDAPSLLAPPRCENQQALSYCPRCLGDFVTAQSRCEACGSRPTVSYAHA